MALEERLLLAAQPVVSIQAADAPINGQSDIVVTFKNLPDTTGGSNIGFAPYVNLVLPARGADGGAPGAAPASPADGVSFVSATYRNAPVTATVLTFDAAGNAVSPVEKNAAGNFVTVRAVDYNARPGDQLVVLDLSSQLSQVESTTPTASILVKTQVSNLADVGTPLTVAARGGFAFGRDSFDNPAVDAPVLGDLATRR